MLYFQQSFQDHNYALPITSPTPQSTLYRTTHSNPEKSSKSFIATVLNDEDTQKMPGLDKQVDDELLDKPVSGIKSTKRQLYADTFNFQTRDTKLRKELEKEDEFSKDFSVIQVEDIYSPKNEIVEEFLDEEHIESPGDEGNDDSENEFNNSIISTDQFTKEFNDVRTTTASLKTYSNNQCDNDEFNDSIVSIDNFSDNNRKRESPFKKPVNQLSKKKKTEEDLFQTSNIFEKDHRKKLPIPVVEVKKEKICSLSDLFKKPTSKTSPALKSKKGKSSLNLKQFAAEVTYSSTKDELQSDKNTRESDEDELNNSIVTFEEFAAVDIKKELISPKRPPPKEKLPKMKNNPKMSILSNTEAILETISEKNDFTKEDHYLNFNHPLGLSGIKLIDKEDFASLEVGTLGMCSVLEFWLSKLTREYPMVFALDCETTKYILEENQNVADRVLDAIVDVNQSFKHLVIPFHYRKFAVEHYYVGVVRDFNTTAPTLVLTDSENMFDKELVNKHQRIIRNFVQTIQHKLGIDSGKVALQTVLDSKQTIVNSCLLKVAYNSFKLIRFFEDGIPMHQTTAGHVEETRREIVKAIRELSTSLNIQQFAPLSFEKNNQIPVTLHKKISKHSNSRGNKRANFSSITNGK